MALAQSGEVVTQPDSPPTSDTDGRSSDIVVTGTLLRGITPPGSQTIAVSRDDAVATGATSTAQLLANVPQVGDFNRRPINQGIQNTQSTVNHPDLRNLGAAIMAGGSSATLLLLDGHRMPGMGVRQTIPDSDAIPPGAIERVEIVTDGGSSIYGADAVGGVVNYITRKRFDGVDLRANYGFADAYQTANFDATVGKDWGSGSLYATYSYGWHDKLYGYDRDFVKNTNYVLNVPLELTCTPGNIIATSATGVTTIYALPGLTPGIGNHCDNNELVTIYPSERRHSAFVGFTQNVTDDIEVGIKAFYTNRYNVSDGGVLPASVSIAPTNPFYRSTGDANAGRAQTLNASFAPVAGTSTFQDLRLETWGIAHDVTAQLGGGWRARALFNFGRAASTVHSDLANATAFQAAVTAGTINPYDLGAPGNAAALATVLNWRNYGKGKQELINYRAVVDGPLFALPGGDINVAVGAEYVIEDYQVVSGLGSKLTTAGLPRGGGHRNTKAAFGELFVPVFGEGNRMGGFYSLALSASARYDDYSDFGGTFNPKLAVTWQPVEWIKVRGNWSKSFQAPSLADSAGTITTAVTVVQRVFSEAPGVPSRAGQVTAFLGGGGENLQPQKATIWSVGADLTPPLVEGLTLSATYWNIKFSDLIAVPPVTQPTLFRDYPSLATTSPTRAQIEAFMQQAPLNNSQLIPYLTRPQDVYVLIDGRRANFGLLKTSGLDFSARLEVPTGFGSVFARTTGSYVLTREEAPVAGQAFRSNVADFTRLRVASTLGTKIGGFRGQVTWLLSGGIHTIPTVANLQQSHVGSYSTFNLFFQHDFGGEGLFNNLSLTLNVDNVLDKDPPAYRGQAGAGQFGYANGFTLGRLVQFGIQKKF
jgi:iron complex outermembrane receptor protein